MNTGTKYTILAAELNNYIGELNAGDIVIDISQDIQNFNDVDIAEFELNLNKTGSNDNVVFFLDSIPMRITYQP